MNDYVAEQNKNSIYKLEQTEEEASWREFQVYYKNLKCQDSSCC